MFTHVQPFKPYIWLEKLPKKPAGTTSRPKTEKIKIWFLLHVPAGNYTQVMVPSSSQYSLIYDGKVREFVITMKNADTSAQEHWIEGSFEIDVTSGMTHPIMENRVKLSVISDGGPGEGGSSIGNYEDSDDD